MNSFISTQLRLPGSNYKEVLKKANLIFDEVARKSKRKPYIRSAYFHKQKIFITLFWTHLFDKSFVVRTHRLKYLAAGIELIKKSKNSPTSKDNPNNKSEILHRFEGVTRDKLLFYVQIKEVKSTEKKYLMSMFGKDE